MELALNLPEQRQTPPRLVEPPATAWALEASELGDILRRDTRQALAWIHARFACVIHGLVLARVGAAEAEDLTQEVFLRVQRKLGDLRDPVALPAWIATIARNLAVEHQRRRGREPRREALREEELAGSAPAAHEDGLRELVLRRLQELPEAYRETLALRLIEGLPGPEIAARTGMQPDSVRVNLCRGMAQLRPLLRKDGVLE